MHRFTRLFNPKLFLLASLPPLISWNKSNNVSHCGWWIFGSSLARNKLLNRVETIEYNANNPIEDRMSYSQLTSVDGYAALVLDGHGGWQVAQFVNKVLISTLDQVIANNKNRYSSQEILIVESIKETFDKVEGDVLQIARQAYSFGLPELSKIGACALLVVVVDNKVYAANAGDSQALIVSEKDGKFTFEKLNKKLNANSKTERKRLQQLFPNEADIVVCKREDTACYVKGRLQPTRSFGDFRLKWKDFNTLPVSQSLQNFRDGPYITHKPEIKVLQLEKSHKYIVMGCDGLWDQLSKLDVTRVVQKKNSKKKEIPKELLSESLLRAAQKRNITVEELKKLEPGARRKSHDDISIIGINLESQHK